MSDIFVGPWGGNGGFVWDDGGKHAGVREIVIHHGGCIDSISLVYDDNGYPVPSPKHGGNGGRKTEIKLAYPKEFLVGVRGHYNQFGAGTVIRSLVLRSNLKTYGPYGTEEGAAFILPMEGGQIAGFRGRGEKYINAIGFYLTSVPAKQKASIRSGHERRL